jgi:hypothetical protein
VTSDPKSMIPITRPQLPRLEQYSALVAELFESRMLSNFGKCTRLLEQRAATILDHPAPSVSRAATSA